MIKSSNRQGLSQMQLSLGSLFSLELLLPSAEMYLFSPWISDIALVDNRVGQYRALRPDEAPSYLRLTELLNHLAQQGTRIHILCRPNLPRNEEVLRRLDPIIKVKYIETFHEKGLITPQFYWRGSMNLTFFGTEVNDEHVEITTDSETVTRALLEAQERWRVLA
ncbi:MAG: phospholipase D-like domain-containing protein DpdK [Candidatus Promineifilaceae bacterium]